MEIESTVADKAISYFKGGYHCAESIVAAVLNEIGEDHQQAACYATAFGGGFGRSFQETCGILSGAMIVIGHFYGRQEQGISWDLPAKLGAAIRTKMIEKFGTTHCGALRERFGEENQLEECQKMTGEIAALLYELLAKEKEELECELETCEC